jgi:hypothetical protein
VTNSGEGHTGETEFVLTQEMRERLSARALRERAPPGPADYLARQIIYVGEGRNLGVRWMQFELSAFQAKPGHSGGWSYRGKYGESRSAAPVRSRRGSVGIGV